MRLSPLPLFIVMIITLSAPSSYAGFADDWISQSTSAAGSSMMGQQRGYLTGGSLSARWQTGSDYPFTIQPPRASAGCGGIDMFMGGFSFLGFDYLVKKLQGILMNAPALAFDLALKALAEQASASMKGLDHIIETVNGLQIDECSIASSLVDDPAGAVSGAWAKAKSEYKVNAGNVATWFQSSQEDVSKDGENTQQEVEDVVSGCNNEIKTIFLSQNQTTGSYDGGMLLEQLSKTNKLNIQQDHIKMMRGLIGDIWIGKAADSFKMAYFPGCPENTNFKVDDIIRGSYLVQAPDGSCSLATDANKNIYQYVMDRIMAIDNSIIARTPLATAEIDFLNSTSFPVQRIIQIAVATNNQGSIYPEMSYLIALSMAQDMIMDLYDRVNYMVAKGEASFVLSFGSTGPGTCATAVLAPDIKKGLDQMRKSLETAVNGISQSYNNNLTKSGAVFAYIESFNKLSASFKNEVMNQFGAGFAERVMGQ